MSFGILLKGYLFWSARRLALSFLGQINYIVEYYVRQQGGALMSTDSMTAIEFQNHYSSEQECINALEKIRWPKGFICPNCGHDYGYKLSSKRLIQCAVCRHQTSVTAGTLFHKTRVPLQNWFWIIYSTAHDKGGASAMRLAQQLNMHYATVWNIVQKIKYAMARRDEGILLAGLIELDTMFVGPEARKMGKPTKRDQDDSLGKH